METVQDPTEQVTKPKRVRLIVGQFNWRMILVRLLVNGLTLLAVALLVPNIYFVDPPLGTLLLMAVALGLLNAFVKPIVQFLTLPFVFVTFGFALVLINTIILLLLAVIFDQVFFVGSLFWALVGGLVMGILASLLESLLGLDLPIVPRDQDVGSSPAPGPRPITSVLVDEVTSDAAVQPAPSEDVLASGEDVSKPTSAEASGEPSMTTTAGEEPAVVEGLENATDKQTGDER